MASIQKNCQKRGSHKVFATFLSPNASVNWRQKGCNAIQFPGKYGNEMKI